MCTQSPFPKATSPALAVCASVTPDRSCLSLGLQGTLGCRACLRLAFLGAQGWVDGITHPQTLALSSEGQPVLGHLLSEAEATLSGPRRQEGLVLRKKISWSFSPVSCAVQISIS